MLIMDNRKHTLRHEKPYYCVFSGCERKTNGFTTINDLDRHKKSRHRIMPPGSKLYKCASESCLEKSKEWPRLDNFRQHCDRMHKDEDTQSLIERSVSRPRLERFRGPELTDALDQRYPQLQKSLLRLKNVAVVCLPLSLLLRLVKLPCRHSRPIRTARNSLGRRASDHGRVCPSGQRLQRPPQ